MNGYWEHVCDYPDASSYSWECYQHLPQIHSSGPVIILAGLAILIVYIAVYGWVSDWLEKSL